MYGQANQGTQFGRGSQSPVPSPYQQCPPHPPTFHFQEKMRPTAPYPNVNQQNLPDSSPSLHTGQSWLCPPPQVHGSTLMSHTFSQGGPYLESHKGYYLPPPPPSLPPPPSTSGTSSTTTSRFSSESVVGYSYASSISFPPQLFSLPATVHLPQLPTFSRPSSSLPSSSASNLPSHFGCDPTSNKASIEESRSLNPADEEATKNVRHDVSIHGSKIWEGYGCTSTVDFYGQPNHLMIPAGRTSTSDSDMDMEG